MLLLNWSLPFNDINGDILFYLIGTMFATMLSKQLQKPSTCVCYSCVSVV